MILGPLDRRLTKKKSSVRQQQSEKIFFAALPDDSFSEEETLLREALYEFLANREEVTPPTFDLTHKDPQIAQARQAFLDGHGVSLKEWCDRRMGEEISFTKSPTGAWTFALVGPSLDWLQQERADRGLKRIRTS
eukprot:gnl/TRDRNA2_/TRDRNA2_174191_c7_seq4.p3 gnl/TRDRNA2_/TRDRNA2_174191_c7~~gnl/TRDRNA2_/TRDRNA2_174191_c7_seq4.p3  ORF type:complete len:135 (-),score=28.93 gnl/TRDRNA2_/TRDRNA2_174191_c7_seq4:112-516(-)